MFLRRLKQVVTLTWLTRILVQYPEPAGPQSFSCFWRRTELAVVINTTVPEAEVSGEAFPVASVLGWGRDSLEVLAKTL